jgi:hypothetical protein
MDEKHKRLRIIKQISQCIEKWEREEYDLVLGKGYSLDKRKLERAL